MLFPRYTGQTKDGKWVEGNLVYTSDVDPNYQAIIIPIEDNGMFGADSVDGLGFEVFHKVNVQSIKLINQ